MGDAMKNVALIGAGGKMGVRIAGKLNSSTYDVKLMETDMEMRERLLSH